MKKIVLVILSFCILSSCKISVSAKILEDEKYVTADRVFASAGKGNYYDVWLARDTSDNFHLFYYFMDSDSMVEKTNF